MKNYYTYGLCLFLVISSVSARQISPMEGEWRGIYGSLSLASHPPILGGRYTVRFNSSLLRG
jgi:hypothetical protein